MVFSKRLGSWRRTQEHWVLTLDPTELGPNTWSKANWFCVWSPQENYNKIIIFRNPRIFITQIIIFFTLILWIIIKIIIFITQIIIFLIWIFWIIRKVIIFITQIIRPKRIGSWQRTQEIWILSRTQAKWVLSQDPRSSGPYYAGPKRNGSWRRTHEEWVLTMDPTNLMQDPRLRLASRATSAQCVCSLGPAAPRGAPAPKAC
jgi:hypothetical protein